MQTLGPLFAAQTLTDLSITLLLYLLLTASSIGCGQMLARFLGIQANAPSPGFVQVWLGWCGLLLLLQLCRFCLPLNIYPCAVVYGFGLFLFARSCVLRGFRTVWDESLKLGLIVWLGILVFAPWVALQGMNTPGEFDSGVYHFNAIRWINEYAIVPGLGNLHDRLAFNDSYLTFVASLNFYPWFNHGHNIALGRLLLLVTAECLFCLKQVGQTIWNKRDLVVGEVLPALLVPYLIYSSFKYDLSSPQPDRVIFLMRLALFAFLWRNLATQDKSEILNSTKLLLVLGITSVTLKLSNLVFASTICLIAVLHCFSAENRDLRFLLKDLGAAMLFSFLILFAWLGCGIITSGYPLYPSTFLALHTDWSMDPTSVKRTADWIYAWARMPLTDPNLVLKDWSWFKPWRESIWEGCQLDVIKPVAIFLGASCVIAPLNLINFSKPKPLPQLYLGILPVMAGLLFWFYTAPEPRFANGLFWLLPLSILCPYVMNLKSPTWKRYLTLPLFALMCFPLYSDFNQDAFTFSDIGWKPIQNGILQERMTLQGLKIYVAPDGQCWDGPVPSTPYFDQALQLRGQGLQSGFKTLPHRDPQMGLQREANPYHRLVSGQTQRAGESSGDVGHSSPN